MKALALTVLISCFASAAEPKVGGAPTPCQTTQVQNVAKPVKGHFDIDTPRLCSVPNFRDVAGIASAYSGTGTSDRTGDGKFLQPGVFYRASVLTLSPADRATISKLGIMTDIDLRTPREIEAANGFDVLPPGVGYVNVNVIGLHGFPKGELKTPADGDKAMLAIYTGFVIDPEEREAFRMVLMDLAYAGGPVLFHCSAGKDRSGWLAAIVQSIAGVPEPIIMRDYLASNQYRDVDPNAVQASGLAEMNTVQPEYLEAALNAVQQHYGSMDSFIGTGIGLSAKDVAALRTKLVGG